MSFLNRFRNQEPDKSNDGDGSSRRSSGKWVLGKDGALVPAPEEAPQPVPLTTGGSNAGGGGSGEKKGLSSFAAAAIGFVKSSSIVGGGYPTAAPGGADADADATAKEDSIMKVDAAVEEWIDGIPIVNLDAKLGSGAGGEDIGEGGYSGDDAAAGDAGAAASGAKDPDIPEPTSDDGDDEDKPPPEDAQEDPGFESVGGGGGGGGGDRDGAAADGGDATVATTTLPNEEVIHAVVDTMEKTGAMSSFEEEIAAITAMNETLEQELAEITAKKEKDASAAVVDMEKQVPSQNSSTRSSDDGGDGDEDGGVGRSLLRQGSSDGGSSSNDRKSPIVMLRQASMRALAASADVLTQLALAKKDGDNQEETSEGHDRDPFGDDALFSGPPGAALLVDDIDIQQSPLRSPTFYPLTNDDDALPSHREASTNDESVTEVSQHGDDEITSSKSEIIEEVSPTDVVVAEEEPRADIQEEEVSETEPEVVAASFDNNETIQVYKEEEEEQGEVVASSDVDEAEDDNHVVTQELETQTDGEDEQQQPPVDPTSDNIATAPPDVSSEWSQVEGGEQGVDNNDHDDDDVSTSKTAPDESTLLAGVVSESFTTTETDNELNVEQPTIKDCDSAPQDELIVSSSSSSSGRDECAVPSDSNAEEQSVADHEEEISPKEPEEVATSFDEDSVPYHEDQAAVASLDVTGAAQDNHVVEEQSESQAEPQDGEEEPEPQVEPTTMTNNIDTATCVVSSEWSQLADNEQVNENDDASTSDNPTEETTSFPPDIVSESLTTAEADNKPMVEPPSSNGDCEYVSAVDTTSNEESDTALVQQPDALDDTSKGCPVDEAADDHNDHSETASNEEEAAVPPVQKQSEHAVSGYEAELVEETSIACVDAYDVDNDESNSAAEPTAEATPVKDGALLASSESDKEKDTQTAAASYGPSDITSPDHNIDNSDHIELSEKSDAVVASEENGDCEQSDQQEQDMEASPGIEQEEEEENAKTQKETIPTWANDDSMEKSAQGDDDILSESERVEEMVLEEPSAICQLSPKEEESEVGQESEEIALQRTSAISSEQSQRDEEEQANTGNENDETTAFAVVPESSTTTETNNDHGIEAHSDDEQSTVPDAAISFETSKVTSSDNNSFGDCEHSAFENNTVDNLEHSELENTSNYNCEHGELEVKQEAIVAPDQQDGSEESNHPDDADAFVASAVVDNTADESTGDGQSNQQADYITEAHEDNDVKDSFAISAAVADVSTRVVSGPDATDHSDCEQTLEAVVVPEDQDDESENAAVPPQVEDKLSLVDTAESSPNVDHCEGSDDQYEGGAAESLANIDDGDNGEVPAVAEVVEQYDQHAHHIETSPNIDQEKEEVAAILNDDETNFGRTVADAAVYHDETAAAAISKFDHVDDEVYPDKHTDCFNEAPKDDTEELVVPSDVTDESTDDNPSQHAADDGDFEGTLEAVAVPEAQDQTTNSAVQREAEDTSPAAVSMEFDFSNHSKACAGVVSDNNNDQDVDDDAIRATADQQLPALVTESNDADSNMPDDFLESKEHKDMDMHNIEACSDVKATIAESSTELAQHPMLFDETSKGNRVDEPADDDGDHSERAFTVVEPSAQEEGRHFNQALDCLAESPVDDDVHQKPVAQSVVQDQSGRDDPSHDATENCDFDEALESVVVPEDQYDESENSAVQPQVEDTLFEAVTTESSVDRGNSDHMEIADNQAEGGVAEPSASSDIGANGEATEDGHENGAAEIAENHHVVDEQHEESGQSQQHADCMKDGQEPVALPCESTSNDPSQGASDCNLPSEDNLDMSSQDVAEDIVGASDCPSENQECHDVEDKITEEVVAQRTDAVPAIALSDQSDCPSAEQEDSIAHDEGSDNDNDAAKARNAGSETSPPVCGNDECSSKIDSPYAEEAAQEYAQENDEEAIMATTEMPQVEEEEQACTDSNDEVEYNDAVRYTNDQSPAHVCESHDEENDNDGSLPNEFPSSGNNESPHVEEDEQAHSHNSDDDAVTATAEMPQVEKEEQAYADSNDEDEDNDAVGDTDDQSPAPVCESNDDDNASSPPDAILSTGNESHHVEDEDQMNELAVAAQHHDEDPSEESNTSPEACAAHTVDEKLSQTDSARDLAEEDAAQQQAVAGPALDSEQPNEFPLEQPTPNSVEDDPAVTIQHNEEDGVDFVDNFGLVCAAEPSSPKAEATDEPANESTLVSNEPSRAPAGEPNCSAVEEANVEPAIDHVDGEVDTVPASDSVEPSEVPSEHPIDTSVEETILESAIDRVEDEDDTEQSLAPCKEPIEIALEDKNIETDVCRFHVDENAGQAQADVNPAMSLDEPNDCASEEAVEDKIFADSDLIDQATSLSISYWRSSLPNEIPIQEGNQGLKEEVDIVDRSSLSVPASDHVDCVDSSPLGEPILESAPLSVSYWRGSLTSEQIGQLNEKSDSDAKKLQNDEISSEQIDHVSSNFDSDASSAPISISYWRSCLPGENPERKDELQEEGKTVVIAAEKNDSTVEPLAVSAPLSISYWRSALPSNQVQEAEEEEFVEIEECNDSAPLQNDAESRSDNIQEASTTPTDTPDTAEPPVERTYADEFTQQEKIEGEGEIENLTLGSVAQPDEEDFNTSHDEPIITDPIDTTMANQNTPTGDIAAFDATEVDDCTRGTSYTHEESGANNNKTIDEVENVDHDEDAGEGPTHGITADATAAVIECQDEISFTQEKGTGVVHCNDPIDASTVEAENLDLQHENWVDVTPTDDITALDAAGEPTDEIACSDEEENTDVAPSVKPISDPTVEAKNVNLQHENGVDVTSTGDITAMDVTPTDDISALDAAIECSDEIASIDEEETTDVVPSVELISDCPTVEAENPDLQHETSADVTPTDDITTLDAADECMMESSCPHEEDTGVVPSSKSMDDTTDHVESLDQHEEDVEFASTVDITAIDTEEAAEGNEALCCTDDQQNAHERRSGDFSPELSSYPRALSLEVDGMEEYPSEQPETPADVVLCTASDDLYKNDPIDPPVGDETTHDDIKTSDVPAVVDGTDETPCAHEESGMPSIDIPAAHVENLASEHEEAVEGAPTDEVNAVEANAVSECNDAPSSTEKDQHVELQLVNITPELSLSKGAGVEEYSAEQREAPADMVLDRGSDNLNGNDPQDARTNQTTPTCDDFNALDAPEVVNDDIDETSSCVHEDTLVPSKESVSDPTPAEVQPDDVNINTGSDEPIITDPIDTTPTEKIAPKGDVQTAVTPAVFEGIVVSPGNNEHVENTMSAVAERSTTSIGYPTERLIAPEENSGKDDQPKEDDEDCREGNVELSGSIEHVPSTASIDDQTDILIAPEENSAKEDQQKEDEEECCDGNLEWPATNEQVPSTTSIDDPAEQWIAPEESSRQVDQQREGEESEGCDGNIELSGTSENADNTIYAAAEPSTTSIDDQTEPLIAPEENSREPKGDEETDGRHDNIELFGAREHVDKSIAAEDVPSTTFIDDLSAEVEEGAVIEPVASFELEGDVKATDENDQADQGADKPESKPESATALKSQPDHCEGEHGEVAQTVTFSPKPSSLQRALRLERGGVDEPTSADQPTVQEELADYTYSIDESVPMEHVDHAAELGGELAHVVHEEIEESHQQEEMGIERAQSVSTAYKPSSLQQALRLERGGGTDSLPVIEPIVSTWGENVDEIANDNDQSENANHNLESKPEAAFGLNTLDDEVEKSNRQTGEYVEEEEPVVDDAAVKDQETSDSGSASSSIPADIESDVGPSDPPSELSAPALSVPIAPTSAEPSAPAPSAPGAAISSEPALSAGTASSGSTVSDPTVPGTDEKPTIEATEKAIEDDAVALAHDKSAGIIEHGNHTPGLSESRLATTDAIGSLDVIAPETVAVAAHVSDTMVKLISEDGGETPQELPMPAAFTQQDTETKPDEDAAGGVQDLTNRKQEKEDEEALATAPKANTVDKSNTTTGELPWTMPKLRKTGIAVVEQRRDEGTRKVTASVVQSRAFATDQTKAPYNASMNQEPIAMSASKAASVDQGDKASKVEMTERLMPIRVINAKGDLVPDPEQNKVQNDVHANTSTHSPSAHTQTCNAPKTSPKRPAFVLNAKGDLVPIAGQAEEEIGNASAEQPGIVKPPPIWAGAKINKGSCGDVNPWAGAKLKKTGRDVVKDTPPPCTEKKAESPAEAFVQKEIESEKPRDVEKEKHIAAALTTVAPGLPREKENENNRASNDGPGSGKTSLWSVKLKKTGRDVMEAPDQSVRKVVASTVAKKEDVAVVDGSATVTEPTKDAAVVPVDAMQPAATLVTKSETEEGLWAVKLKKTGIEVVEPVPDRCERTVVASSDGKIDDRKVAEPAKEVAVVAVELINAAEASSTQNEKEEVEKSVATERADNQSIAPSTAPLWAVKLKKTGREVAEPVPDHSARKVVAKVVSTKQENVKCEDIGATCSTEAEPVKEAVVVAVEAVQPSAPLTVETSEPKEVTKASSETSLANQTNTPSTAPLWAVKLKKTGRAVAEPVPDHSARKVVARVASKTAESSTKYAEGPPGATEVPSGEPLEDKQAALEQKDPAPAPKALDSSESKMTKDQSTETSTLSKDKVTAPTAKTFPAPVAMNGPAAWSLGKLKKAGPKSKDQEPDAPTAARGEKSTETLSTEKQPTKPETDASEKSHDATIESAADPGSQLSASLLKIESKPKPAPSTSGSAPAWAVKLKKTGVDVVEKESNSSARKVVAPPKKTFGATSTPWSMSKLKKTGMNMEEQNNGK